MTVQIRALESLNSYVADGVTTVWNFSFAGGYIDAAHIKAFAIDTEGEVTPQVLVVSGPSQVTIDPPVPVNNELTILRQTPTNAPMVDFLDKTNLTEADLDLTAKQAVFAAAEAKDWASFRSDFGRTQLDFSLIASAADNAVAAGESRVAASLSEVAAAASAAAAASSATDAATDATNSALSVATAQAAADAAKANVATIYTTVALGIAGTAADQFFDVTPTLGLFHYRYLRVGASDAKFVGFVARYPAAQAIRDKLLVLRSNTAPKLPRAMFAFWDTETARKWDHRTIENELAITPPTLNLVPDPFCMVDEQGDSTPVRTMTFDPTVTDPLGGTMANKIAWSTSFQPICHLIRTTVVNLPLDDYTSIVQAMLVDAGPVNLCIGAAGNNAGEFATLALTGAWQELKWTNTGYSNATKAFDLGVRHDGTVAAANAALFGLRMYDKKAGTYACYPTLAEELAASKAGHLKQPAAHAGAVPLDANGWVKWVAGWQNFVACFQRQNVSEMTIFCVLDVQSNPDGGSGYAHGIGVGAHLETGVTNLKGQIGIYKDTYKVYCNPALSVSVARSTDVMLNQGPTLLMLQIKNGRCVASINGVAQFDDDTHTQVTGYTAFALERLVMLAYDGTKKRAQVNQIFKDPANYFGVALKFLTEAEVAAVDEHIRFRARLSGRPMGLRSQLVVGCGDSLTGFPDAPFMRLLETSVGDVLRPGTHSALDAWGGSFHSLEGEDLTVGGLNRYDAIDRRTIRQNMMKAGLSAGYHRVFAHWQYGTNDMVSGVMDPDGSHTWQSGRDIIDAMVMEDKAICDDGTGRLKTVLVTVPPNPSNTSTRAAARLEYNDDCRANWKARGYDYLIDLASYVPAGWTTLEAASQNAFDTNVTNDVFLNGGIHWSTIGGKNAAAAVFVPFYQARLAEVTGEV